VIALDEGKIVEEGAPVEVLTSQKLADLGFGLSRYTTVARKAEQQGLWLADRRLPITLEEAVEGFQRGKT